MTCRAGLKLLSLFSIPFPLEWHKVNGNGAGVNWNIAARSPYLLIYTKLCWTSSDLPYPRHIIDKTMWQLLDRSWQTKNEECVAVLIELHIDSQLAGHSKCNTFFLKSAFFPVTKYYIGRKSCNRVPVTWSLGNSLLCLSHMVSLAKPWPPKVQYRKLMLQHHSRSCSGTIAWVKCKSSSKFKTAKLCVMTHWWWVG